MVSAQHVCFCNARGDDSGSKGSNKGKGVGVTDWLQDMKTRQQLIFWRYFLSIGGRGGCDCVVTSC